MQALHLGEFTERAVRLPTLSEHAQHVAAVRRSGRVVVADGVPGNAGVADIDRPRTGPRPVVASNAPLDIVTGLENACEAVNSLNAGRGRGKQLIQVLAKH